MRTRPQRIALSRIVNTVITKSVTNAPSVLSASPLPDVPPAAEEEVNPWVGKTIRIGFSLSTSHIPITINLEQTAQENNIPVEITQGSQEEIRQKFFNDELDLVLVSLSDYFQRPESYISSDVCVCS